MSREDREQYDKASGYFLPTFLEKVPQSGLPTRIDLDPDQVRFLVDVGLFERFHGDTSKALAMHIFLVDECAKKRKRLIIHTMDINAFTEETVDVSFNRNFVEDGLQADYA
jgi:hypothetical protein